MGTLGCVDRKMESCFDVLVARPALRICCCCHLVRLSALSGGARTSDISISSTGALPAAVLSMIFKFPSVILTLFPFCSKACIMPFLVHDFFTSGCCYTDFRHFMLVGVRSSTIPLPLPFSSRLFWITCVLCFRDRNFTMIGLGLFSRIPTLCAMLISVESMWFNPRSSLMIASTFSSQSFVVSRPLFGPTPRNRRPSCLWYCSRSFPNSRSLSTVFLSFSTSHSSSSMASFVLRRSFSC